MTTHDTRPAPPGAAKASALARLCGVRPLPGRVLEDVDAALVRLLREAVSAVRADVALQLSACDWAPVEAVRMLAFDEIDIARPILESSHRLADADLEALARLDRARRSALAKRSTLTARLTAAIASQRETECLIVLAGNRGARIGDSSAADFTSVARHAPELQRRLAARADLPAGMVRALMAVAEDAVRAELSARWPDLAPDRLAAIASDAAGRLTHADDDADARAATLVEGLARRRLLSAADLVRAASGGRDAVTDQIAARLTGLDIADWRRALARAPLRASLLCARATALAAEDAALFHQALAGSGRAHALASDRLAAACEEIYAAYAPDDARRALHRLGAGASIH